jgi:zinc/manganese transport system permease protein
MNDLAASLGILWPALVAGLLVVASHVPLGQQVLRRGIVFIDLAIAQVAGLGVIAAHAFGMELGGWQTQVAAVAAALLGALLLTWTERKRPEVQEALIGVLFVLASTAQILLLANNPHGGEELKDLLAGQILWVSTDQLVRAAVLTAVFLAVWFRGRTRIGSVGFYVLFALMVTMSVQLVGVYLVFTTLIVPALATYRHGRSRQLVLGYVVAFASYAVGLAVSLVTDLPSSPVIVWAMAVLGIAMHLTARPARGAVHLDRRG